MRDLKQTNILDWTGVISSLTRLSTTLLQESPLSLFLLPKENIKDISLCSSLSSSNSTAVSLVQYRRREWDSVQVSHYKSNKLMHSVRLNFNCTAGHWALLSTVHYM